MKPDHRIQEAETGCSPAVRSFLNPASALYVITTVAVVMGSAVMSDMTRKRRSSALKRRRGTGGLQLAPFPFTAAGHVIHRGRGSLAAVQAAGDRSHPFYQWAEDHHAPHFAGVPGADQRYHALLQEFRKQTGPLTGTTLAAACHRAPGRHQ
jgi:hypothetical protein